MSMDNLNDEKVAAAHTEAGLAGDAVEIINGGKYESKEETQAVEATIEQVKIPKGFVAVEPTQYDIPAGFTEVKPSGGVPYDPAIHGDIQLPTKVMFSELDEAKGLLNLIGTEESNNDYNIAYGQKSAKQDFSTMTINQVLQWQADYVEDGSPSSAVGKYQIIRKTLRELVKTTNLTGNEKFTPQLQDELAVALMNRRGYNKWLSGDMDTAEFANNLAKEWASLPVVSGSKRGRSYYSGDGLNESRISVDALLKVLGEERGLIEEGAPVATSPERSTGKIVGERQQSWQYVPEAQYAEFDAELIESGLPLEGGIYALDDGRRAYRSDDGSWQVFV